MPLVVEELKLHPWASGLATLAATLAGLNASPLWLGVEPIIADSVTLMVVLVAAAAWIRRPSPDLHSLKATPEAPKLVGLDGAPIGERTPKQATATSYLRTVVLVALSACLAWTMRMPVSHALQLAADGRWTVCGEFRASCAQAACIKFLDSRSRPIDATCHSLQDSAGYLEWTAPTWLSYRPAYVTAFCDKSETRPVSLPTSLVGPNCSGRMELR